ncbi:MAG TPA: sensor histidine kinase [Candidatus Limnocylindrales bacterium]
MGTARANNYAGDVAVAFVVALPVSLPFVTGPPGEETVLGAFLNAGTVLPLVWRRRAPFAVALVVACFGILVSAHHMPGQTLQYGGMVAIYTVVDLGRSWQRRLFLGAILTLLPVGAWLKGGDPVAFMYTVLLPLNAYLLGTLARTARGRADALAERTRQLQRERAADAARVVAEERARIGRDMHDVLAHSVGMMVVQAEAGPVVVRTDPERAERVFGAIAAAGREAMVQLRNTLAVLDGPPGAGESARLTAAAIPALVARMAVTETKVEMHAQGVPHRLGVEADEAAYRIVQEALTNVMRHSGAGLAVVRLEWGGSDLAITVSDNGTGAGECTPGRGLDGIRERAAACGGSAKAGNAPGGGFRVEARLPYPERENA